MFALPPRAGSICGWTPSNDSNETLCTTLSTTSSYTLCSYPSYPSFPLADTHDAHSPIPRSLSFDSILSEKSFSDAADTSSTYTPYTNPTSARRYKIKRQLDPSWAPRPPNAFILFRRDYVEKHKGDNSVSDPKEKTHSKRAGDAWKALSAEEKQPWFELAKVEALKHAAANPNYVYRPKKHRSEPRRHPAFLSRREQVEEFVRKAARRRALSSRDRRPPSRSQYDCPTPGSAGSASSPEPPGTPSSEESNPFSDAYAVSRSRSDSLHSHLSFHMSMPMPPPNRSFTSHPAMLSMPSLLVDRPLAPKRSLSYSDMPPYSMSEYINLGDDYSEPDDQSIVSFESAISEPLPSYDLGEPSEQSSPVGCEITLQTPEGPLIPEPQLRSDSGLLPGPQTAPDAINPLHTLLPPSAGIYATAPPGPLFERRRRAATISSLPSPLTVVTSSLSGWARDDLVTARLAPRPDPLPPPPSFGIQPMTDEDDWTRNIPPNRHEALSASIPETDLDSTPRVPVFPQNIQDSGLPPPLDHLNHLNVEFSMQEPQQDGLPEPIPPQYHMAADDITSDLECYSMGLRQYGIGNGGAEAANYGIPPFEVDYSCFLSCDSAREQD